MDFAETASLFPRFFMGRRGTAPRGDIAPRGEAGTDCSDSFGMTGRRNIGLTGPAAVLGLRYLPRWRATGPKRPAPAIFQHQPTCHSERSEESKEESWKGQDPSALRPQDDKRKEQDDKREERDDKREERDDKREEQDDKREERDDREHCFGAR